MALNSHIYIYDGSKSFTLLKWKTRIGNQVLHNSVIFSYKYDGITKCDGKDPMMKYKSNVGGTVVELLASEGDIIQPGAQLLKVEPCTHPVIMKDLCAECGADLRNLDRDNFEKLTAATTFSMVHVVPELKVCLEQAEKLGQDDENRLLKSRKLVLLVDLDQTLIHTTNDNVLKDLPDVHHFQLYGLNSPWYHTKLRPGTQNFLINISKYFELHICTFGARLYAHKIAQILDPDGKLFSHRILSRDECFDATSKTGNLKALFPRGDDMVCIIDDREDVWNYAPNVVHVKPYCYFTNTGDINAPPFCSLAISTQENSTVTDPNNGDADQTEDYKDDSKNEEAQNEPSLAIPESKINECQNSTIDSGNKGEENMESSKKENSSSKDTKPCAEIESGKIDEKSSSNDASRKTIAESEVHDNKKLSEPSKQNEALPDNTLEKSEPFNEFVANDDYLLYLEEILINIHKKYYKMYDQMKKEGNQSIPDLKSVVPDVRGKILKGCNIVFSSVIPTNLLPETSRFWTIAESLGAEVTLDLVLESAESKTTHVVSSKLGTAKVNAAKRHPDIFIVSIDWLFSCAERWERTDERLFPLIKDIVPPFLDGHKTFSKKVDNTFYDPITGKSLKKLRGSKRTHGSMKKKSQKSKKNEDMFSERIFLEAGLALSQEDIEDMDREIDEACSGESEKGSQTNSSSESSNESLSSGDYPKGWKKPRKDILEEDLKDVGDESSDADTIGSVDEEMAEAVRKEFGS